MSGTLRLALEFDPVALEADLRRIPGDAWITHFNTADHDGGWSGVALRGPAGVEHPILLLTSNPGMDGWSDTRQLAECACFAEVLSSFACPVTSARLLRLAPGSVIREHTDPALGLDEGVVRLHVPVLTGPWVEFVVGGSRVWMKPGETWYIDAGLPHRVANTGSGPRVHLVLDCVLDDWLREQFERARALAVAPGGPARPANER